MKKPPLFLALILAFLPALVSHAAPPRAVIWKMDDLRAGRGGAPFPPEWAKFLEFAERERMPVSVGVITVSLEDAPPEYVAEIRRLHASGLVEFWNHGYLHDRDKDAGTSEFRGSSYEHQLERFSKGQKLAREKLGFPFRAFGAPFNHTDKTTRAVLKTDPDLRVWLYGPPNEPDLVVLRRVVNFEVSTGKVDYDAFVAQFLANSQAPVLVLQGHPAAWKAEDFDAFVRAVAFLRDQGVRFVNPSDYAAAP